MSIPEDRKSRDELRQAKIGNDELSPYPVQQQASGGRMALLAIAIVAILGVVFFGLNNSAVAPTGSTTTTQTAAPAPTSSANNATPGAPGTTTGSSATSPPAQTSPPAASGTGTPSNSDSSPAAAPPAPSTSSPGSNSNN